MIFSIAEVKNPLEFQTFMAKQHNGKTNAFNALM
jgi:hypothetical protein